MYMYNNILMYLSLFQLATDTCCLYPRFLFFLSSLNGWKQNKNHIYGHTL